MESKNTTPPATIIDKARTSRLDERPEQKEKRNTERIGKFPNEEPPQSTKVSYE